MKLRSLIKSCFIAVPFTATIFFSASEASADQARLQLCVQKCTEQMHVCITGQEPNLSVVCNGVAECNGMDQNDLKVFHDVCALCIKGATDNCPSAPNPATPKDETPKPAAQPASTAQPLPPVPPLDTFESRCRSLRGEPITEEDPVTHKQINICLTIKGLHRRLSVVEQKLERFKATGQPVPPDVKKEAQIVIDGTADLLRKIEAAGGELRSYEKEMSETLKRLRAGFEGILAKEVKRLDSRIDWHDHEIKTLQNAVISIPHPAPAPVASTSVRNTLLGMYVGPYYGRQAYNQYGVGLNAVGLELGLLPSLSESGRWRLEFNGGAGYGGRNHAEANGFSVTKNLWEMHAHAGPRYTWESGFALTGGVGMNRRASFSHDDTSMTWIGAFAQPSYTLTGSSGHGVYILGRLGVGNTHYQHLIVDKTGNKLDLEFNFGLGYAFLP